MESDHVRRCALPVALAAFAVSSASGQTLQASIDPPVRVTPKRIAAIDADGRIIGDWVEYVDRPRPAGSCSFDLAYDTFWPDPLTGEPIGGEQCRATFAPWTRWYRGPEYHAPLHYDDATFVYTNEPIDRYQTAWYWGLTDTLLIRVRVLQVSSSLTCEGVPFGNFQGGWVLDFGTQAAGEVYYTDVNLCDVGETFPGTTYPQMIITEYMQWYHEPTGLFGLSPGPVQPMLWGIEEGLEPGGVGSHTGWYLADDRNINGIIDFPDECGNSEGSVDCPDPLAPMHAFYSAGANPEACRIELTVLSLRAGQRPEFRVDHAVPGRLISIRYTTQPFGTGPPVYGQVGGFCAESELRPVAGLGEACRIVAGSDGIGSCTAGEVIPPGYQGVTFNFQAFEAGHCPEACDSEVVSMTVIG